MSDQRKFVIVGASLAGADRVAFRGDRERREFVAFWMKGVPVRAGMAVSMSGVIDPLRRLADVEVPLDDLAPALAANAPSPGGHR